MSAPEDLKPTINQMYVNAISSTDDDLGISLYVNLVRVGVSLILAAFGFLTITLLLFAPSFPFLPYGRFTQVLLGVIGSTIALKMYNFLKVSHTTFLKAGRESDGKDILLEKLTKSPFRRYFSTVLSIAIASVIPVLAVYLLGTWSESTMSGGLLHDFSSELQFLILIGLIGTEMGLMTTFVGFTFLFWALSTPMRLAVVYYYRYLKFDVILRVSKTLQSYLGIELYTKPAVICETCYNSKFKIVSSDDGEFLLQCTKCSDGLSEEVDLESIGVETDLADKIYLLDQGPPDR
ncbi:hypothetical protein [Halosimplex carlsbadense]|uniref:hypothetical protein n=1 Tax=Halosimplex carlsbadense TaxID=171164 RepID=UPI001268C986|nr:hypothetical protein [Halosimplex carlsbadense]